MVRSRRPGLTRADQRSRAPRTPGLLGVNDAADPSLRPEGLVGDTPGLLGVNDWAVPRFDFAASPAVRAARQSERPLSEVAENKMWDLFKDHPNQIGSELKKRLGARGNAGLPTRYANRDAAALSKRQSTDCITFVIAVLSRAYEEKGQSAVAKRVRGLGAYGTKLASYLVSIGWKAHYWNPDVNHPFDNSGEHPASYRTAQQSGTYYGVPVSGLIVNYNPTVINQSEEDRRLGRNNPTAKETAAFDRFKDVRFAFGVAYGGNHTFLCSYAYVFEVHWLGVGDDNFKDHVNDRGDDLYERSTLATWGLRTGDLSGIVVVPGDINFNSEPRRPRPARRR